MLSTCTFSRLLDTIVDPKKWFVNKLMVLPREYIFFLLTIIKIFNAKTIEFP